MLSNGNSPIIQLPYSVGRRGHDSLSAGGDLPFQFDKSWNLLFSIVFGFETINFDKFIIYYNFLSFSIRFLSNFYCLLSNFYQNSIEFYRILSNSIVLGRYDMFKEFYSSRTRSRYRNLQSRILLTEDRPEIGIIAYPYLSGPILH